MTKIKLLASLVFLVGAFSNAFSSATLAPVSPAMRTMPFLLAASYEGKTSFDKNLKKAELEFEKYGCSYDEILAFKLESLGIAVLSLE